MPYRVPEERPRGPVSMTGEPPVPENGQNEVAVQGKFVLIRPKRSLLPCLGFITDYFGHFGLNWPPWWLHRAG